MRVTLDASVVSAYLASDVHHAISMKLLGTVIENKIDINAPVLVLAEVAAALARNTRDPQRGLAAQEMIEQTPRLQLSPPLSAWEEGCWIREHSLLARCRFRLCGRGQFDRERSCNVG